MVPGSKAEGGASSGIPGKDRRTVLSIKEVARNHSELEIYAVLKESNMDPDETAQKLLNQDPFHEVKKKKDKKKENTGQGIPSEPRQTTSATPWTNPQIISDRNGRRGSFTRTTPGVSHEFRVVRDNRVNQIFNGDAKQVAGHTAASGHEQAQFKMMGKSSEIKSDQKHPIVIHSDGKSRLFVLNNYTASGASYAKTPHAADSNRPGPDTRNAAISKPNMESQKEADHIPSTLASSRSAFGIYSSSSDPIHVPSDSRAAGAVGAIRREVGVVGKRPNPQPSVSTNSSPASPVRRDISISTESSGQSIMIPKGTQSNQNSTTERPASGNSVRTFQSNQHGIKQHPQPVGHSKASQSTMEWKPKTIKKPSSNDAGVESQISSPEIIHTETLSRANVEVIPDKLSEVNINENEHVIIPMHLRVPEAERVHVTFGSFGNVLNASKDTAIAPYSSKSLDDSPFEPLSATASAPEESSRDASVGERADYDDDQSRDFRPASPASPSHSGKSPLENVDSRSIENYTEAALTQGHSHSHSSPEPHDLQASSDLPSPNLPTFSEAYGMQQNYEVPFLRETMADNIQAQALGSLPEVSSNAPSSSPSATVPMFPHQQPLSQHQSITQLYPQLQFSHFPNYLPYRQILSPMYVPPMAIPTNYTTNPAYPHPSNGNSYLLMPGGSSHLAAGGMKFAASPFKPAAAGTPTGYGNYTSPAGYAISSPGSVGNATGLDDISRIKYKDSSLYVPNPQAETSEIWVQNPRDITGMQSPHYYNVPGQAPHAAYLPTHAGHAASFNAAVQPSHIQFPGLYHPPQPAAIANAHHLVHQQVPPSMGGNAGVGMAAPGPQVGSYQQPQIGHLNWSSSF